jgi:hypothetical protein
VRVESQAGKFILSFEEMEPGNREIVITGKMGLWDAKTFMSLSEFVRVLMMTMRPRMILFLIKALFGGGRAPADGGH